MCMCFLHACAQIHLCRNAAQSVSAVRARRSFRVYVQVMSTAGCYSTSHSKWWRRGLRAAGRRRDRQLFPPHISVQRHHQSLAEMSVLQAGDRPLNVSPSQVNIQSQPALQTGMGGEWGQGVDEDNKRKHGDSD